MTARSDFLSVDNNIWQAYQIFGQATSWRQPEDELAPAAGCDVIGAMQKGQVHK